MEDARLVSRPSLVGPISPVFIGGAYGKTLPIHLPMDPAVMRLKTAFAATLFAAVTVRMPAVGEDLRYCDHGEQLSRQRQHAEAIRYLNHRIKAGQLTAPSMVSALLKLGKALALTKQLDCAIRYFSAAI